MNLRVDRFYILNLRNILRPKLSCISYRTYMGALIAIGRNKRWDYLYIVKGSTLMNYKGWVYSNFKTHHPLVRNYSKIISGYNEMTKHKKRIARMKYRQAKRREYNRKYKSKSMPVGYSTENMPEGSGMEKHKYWYLRRWKWLRKLPYTHN